MKYVMDDVYHCFSIIFYNWTCQFFLTEGFSLYTLETLDSFNFLSWIKNIASMHGSSLNTICLNKSGET